MSMNEIDKKDSKLAIAILATISLLSIVSNGISPLFIISVLLLIILLLNHFVFKIPYTYHDVILSAVSEDGLDWNPEPGVRINVGGSKNHSGAYHPFVVRMEDGFRMYFRGGNAPDRIMSAVSKNGVDWSDEDGVRIDIGGSFDSARVRFPHIVKTDKQSRLYYTGSKDGKKFRILSATSTDGLAWEKEKGVRIDCNGKYDKDDAQAPFIVKFGEFYRMYYEGASNKQRRILSATSTDGLAWEKEKGIRIDLGGLYSSISVSCPCIVKFKEIYRMYYCGDNAFGIRNLEVMSGKSHQVILSAVSKDGVVWEKETGVRVSPSSKHAGDGVLSPFVLSDGRGYRMYYCGFWGKCLLRPILNLRDTLYLLLKIKEAI